MPAAPPNSMDEERSEISLLIGYFSRQDWLPMRVGDSSVGGEAGQFHTARWVLVMASVGVDTVKTLIHRLRGDPRALSGVDLHRGPAEIVNT
jgi:hypothetical protein